jgi:hypothetical protein
MLNSWKKRKLPWKIVKKECKIPFFCLNFKIGDLGSLKGNPNNRELAERAKTFLPLILRLLFSIP